MRDVRNSAAATAAPRAQTLEAVLHQMPQPTLLSGCDGRLAFANSAALALLTEADGLQLKNGLISASNGDASSFRVAIAEACHQLSPRSEAILVRRQGRSPLLVSVAPVRETDGGRWALVLINSVDSLGGEVLIRLQRLFRLSRAEAEIAAAITTGVSIGDIAKARRVTEGTVRTQVKSLASKLGCRRQAEIAVLVKTVSQTSAYECL